MELQTNAGQGRYGLLRRGLLRTEQEIMVTDLTEESFTDDVLTSSEPVLVEFWASWCSSCKAMFPHLDKLSEAQDKLKITKLNLEDAPDLVMSYGIRSIPAMLVFQNGEVIETLTGSRTYDKLVADLGDLL
jgi:thioredoxin 1